MLAAAILLATAALGAVGATDDICTLNLQTQLKPSEEPLILEVNETRDKRQMLEIIRPQVEVIGGKNQGVISLQDGKQLLIACTGPKNAVTASGKESSYAECSKGRLTINNRPATKENLSCTKGVAKSWLVKTKEQCGSGDNKGTKFEIGFQLTDEKQETFFSLVEACHNIDKMVTYYTSHQLYGASLNGAIKSSERRSFSPGPKGMGLYKGISAEASYSQKGQKEALDKILGPDASEKYLSKTVFLARGHLSPDADFIYNSGQQMTYYYVNAAPQWQTFNAFNWLAVENTVRKLAAKEDTTLNVWTGTYGILKLKDNNGNEKEIYLAPNESGEGDLPVPEIYWKLVQHPTKLSCTVAVGHNNVFLTEPPTPICNPEPVDGWPSLTRLDRGYVYYCDYDNFKKAVSYVPDVECTDLFKFSR